MKRAMLIGAGLALALFGVGSISVAEAAGDEPVTRTEKVTGQHKPTSSHYRHKRRTAVRGYVARRGGYSYYAGDSINTYGDSRSLYGHTRAFRSWHYDRQTLAGPFDHGFFFDSGIQTSGAQRGGDSPYMH